MDVVPVQVYMSGSPISGPARSLDIHRPAHCALMLHDGYGTGTSIPSLLAQLGNALPCVCLLPCSYPPLRPHTPLVTTYSCDDESTDDTKHPTPNPSTRLARAINATRLPTRLCPVSAGLTCFCIK